MTPISQANFKFTQENGDLIYLYETNGGKIYAYNVGEYSPKRKQNFENWICGSKKTLWDLASLIRTNGQRIA